MASDKSDLLQGTLDMLVLKIVALEPAHGYGIAQRIQQISRDVLQVQQGSLYPALHRLENKKLLTAEWGPTETGREAKFYRLSARGRKQLTAELTRWNRYTSVVGLIVNAKSGGASGAPSCGSFAKPVPQSTESHGQPSAKWEHFVVVLFRTPFVSEGTPRQGVCLEPQLWDRRRNAFSF